MARDGTDPRHALGRRGEDRALEYLRGLGYHIVERNFRCKLGEIDIVARDGSTLVFVEVRTRRSARFGSALDSVGRTKQLRIARLAAAYATMRRPRFESCRFDVIGITRDRVEHIRDAFRLGLDVEWRA